MKRQLQIIAIIAFVIFGAIIASCQTTQLSAAKAILDKSPLNSYITGVRDTTALMQYIGDLYFIPCHIGMDKNRHRIIECQEVEGDWFQGYCYFPVELITAGKRQNVQLKIPVLYWDKNVASGVKYKFRKVRLAGNKSLSSKDGIYIFIQQ